MTDLAQALEHPDSRTEAAEAIRSLIDTIVLVPMDRLARDLFVSGDFYRGDLLGVVLRAERAFWLRSPSELERAQDLAAQALKRLPGLKTTDEIRASLVESAEDLLGLRRSRGDG